MLVYVFPVPKYVLYYSGLLFQLLIQSQNTFCTFQVYLFNCWWPFRLHISTPNNIISHTTLPQHHFHFSPLRISIPLWSTSVLRLLLPSSLPVLWPSSSTTSATEQLYPIFFMNKLNDMDVDYMRFQQDGAMCHTVGTTLDILHERFESMVLCRRDDVNWPPRSYNLTLLDFSCGISWSCRSVPN